MGAADESSVLVDEILLGFVVCGGGFVDIMVEVDLPR